MSTMMRIALITMTLYLCACSSLRTALEPKEGKVSVPMPAGKYGYIVADNYSIADYGYYEDDKHAFTLPYEAVKRGNIFYVLRYEQTSVSKSNFLDAVAKSEWQKVSKHYRFSSDDERKALWHDVKKGVYQANNASCSTRRCLDSPPAILFSSHQVPFDPPSRTAITGIKSELVESYEVKRRWSDGSANAGVVATFGKDSAAYEALYVSLYPSDYFSTSERAAWIHGLSLNIGVAKKAIWSSHEDEADDIDDSKLMIGLGYSLDSAGEIVSIQLGHLSGRQNGERLSELYAGISLDILKALDFFGKE
ncbi:MAG: hypothetical protein VYE54_14120 [Pseudomonadota bacterium]|nr:hypothetical protein [Pseudomonadota bacterium]